MKLLLIPITFLALSTNAYAMGQQDTMKSCNAEATAKQLKGDARTAFMSDCLKTQPALTAQQNKIKTCNADAAKKELRGDQRKTFLQACLSH